jgi:exocyst complex component 7
MYLQAKSNLFMINNAFYLLEELGPKDDGQDQENDLEHYRIDGTWFADKIEKTTESEKTKYLGNWQVLNTHLTAVGDSEIEYQKKMTDIMSLDSGRLIKQRFKGFNEDFERIYALHQKLCLVHPRLQRSMQDDVAKVFLPRYKRFYEKYTKMRFSKKHQDEYTKYSPDKVLSMLQKLYVGPE